MGWRGQCELVGCQTISKRTRGNVKKVSVINVQWNECPKFKQSHMTPGVDLAGGLWADQGAKALGLNCS